MREQPPQRQEYSVIGFDALTAGMTHARFDMLCTSHGSGDSYSWLGAGENTYTVTRGGTTAVMDGWPINDWRLTIRRQDGEVLNITVDCVKLSLQEDGSVRQPSEVANEVYWAVTDAQAELQEKDKDVRLFMLPDGAFHPNLRFGE